MENRMLLFQVNLTPDYDNIKVSLPVSKQYKELNNVKIKSVEMPYAHPIRLEVQAIELSKYVLEITGTMQSRNYDFYITGDDQFGPCDFFVAAIRKKK